MKHVKRGRLQRMSYNNYLFMAGIIHIILLYYANIIFLKIRIAKSRVSLLFHVIWQYYISREHSWGEMYIGHGGLSVCLSLAAFPHYGTEPD